MLKKPFNAGFLSLIKLLTTEDGDGMFPSVLLVLLLVLVIIPASWSVAVCPCLGCSVCLLWLQTREAVFFPEHHHLLPGMFAPLFRGRN
jgi:hypothetical protein